MSEKIPTRLIVVAAAISAGALLIAAAAQGHSEPLPRRSAVIAGTTYIFVEPPHALSKGLRHQPRPHPEGGMKVTLSREGEAIASTTSSSTGVFSFAVRPGRYVVSARVGPPHFTPGHGCGNTPAVSVTAQQTARVRITCDF
jgi:hypothetical protein